MFAMEYNGNGLRLPNETALLDDLIMIYLIRFNLNNFFVYFPNLLDWGRHTQMFN